MAAEAAYQARQPAEPGEMGPWQHLDCNGCLPRFREIRGCTSESTATVQSITRKELTQRRCKRALLNPETDLFDVELAEVLAMAGDIGEAGFGSLGWDRLSEQPAAWVEAMRTVRSTWRDMESREMAAARKKAQRKAGR